MRGGGADDAGDDVGKVDRLNLYEGILYEWWWWLK